MDELDSNDTVVEFVAVGNVVSVVDVVVIDVVSAGVSFVVADVIIAVAVVTALVTDVVVVAVLFDVDPLDEVVVSVSVVLGCDNGSVV